MASQPFTLKWGIMATGGIAQSEFYIQLQPIRLPYLTVHLYSFHQGPTCQSRKTWCPRRRSQGDRSRVLVLQGERHIFPRKGQGPRRRQSVWFLRWVGKRPGRRDRLRRNSPQPSFPEHYASSGSRQACSVWEGFYSHRFPGTEAGWNCQGQEPLPDGSRLDTVLPSQHQDPRTSTVRSHWPRISSYW